MDSAKSNSIYNLPNPVPPERIISTAMKTLVRSNFKNQYNSLNPRKHSGLITLNEEESASFDEEQYLKDLRHMKKAKI